MRLITFLGLKKWFKGYLRKIRDEEYRNWYLRNQLKSKV
jgi:hypothetical protein